MEVTRTRCNASGCTKEASFVCPYCHQEEENQSKDTQHEGRYCSNECFKLSWPTHKTIHKPAAAGDLSALDADDVLALDMAMAGATIGRQRSRSTSAISCRYNEPVDREGNPIALDVHDHNNNNDNDNEDEQEQDDLDVNPLPPPVIDNSTVNHDLTGDLTGNLTGRGSNIIGASYHNLIPPLPPHLPNYYPWQTTYPQVDTLTFVTPDLTNHLPLRLLSHQLIASSPSSRHLSSFTVAAVG